MATPGLFFPPAAAVVVLLSFLLQLVAAHGEDHGHIGAPLPAAPPSTTPASYWSHVPYAGVMYAHILFMSLAWMIVLPVSVMLSIARSRLTLPVQCTFLVANAFGLVLSVIYRRKTPTLYENDSHTKIGWTVTWIATAWVLMGLVDLYAGRTRASDQYHGSITTAAMARYSHLENAELPNSSRWSGDSGQGTERNSVSLCSPLQSQLASRTNSYARHEDDDDHLDQDGEKQGFLEDTAVDRFLSSNIPKSVFVKALVVLRFIYAILDRIVVILSFLALSSGVVVYGGIARGSAVFNVLAHLVKGGIFFWYGILTLGRWMGCFSDFGWAWNVKPGKEIVSQRKTAMPSAEFTESFVMFLYGITNVFMEHLAAWGEAWTAQDLQHVSISVMFFGGGLLGMLIESNRLRDLLNSYILSSQDASQTHTEHWTAPKPYRFSMNPLPGLIILLLGSMMSSHHQHSMLSTMIHKQWGTLFVGFAFARAVTYIMLYISPPTSYLPSRPPSEIITSFCLIAGGLVFMESNKDTIAALESYGLDAMFTLVLSIALTVLVMAWTMVLVAIKNWAFRRQHGSDHTQARAGVVA